MGGGGQDIQQEGGGPQKMSLPYAEKCGINCTLNFPIFFAEVSYTATATAADLTVYR